MVSRAWWHVPVAPDTGEAGAGGSQVQELVELYSEFEVSLSKLARLFLNIQKTKNKGWGCTQH